MVQLQNKRFHDRLASSDKNTLKCVNKLLEIKHIVKAKKSTTERDKNDGVDFDFDYKDEENIANQFKVRYKNRSGLPVVVYQPFYGMGDERTEFGRDLRCLLDKKTKWHYVGIVDRDEKLTMIYCAESAKVRKVVSETLRIWNEYETKMLEGIEPDQIGAKWFKHDVNCIWIERANRNPITESNRKVFELPNQTEIWWKKNASEKYAKFNLYIPKELVSGKVVYEL